MVLLPLDASHDALLQSLQVQEDVWEFLGPLPEPGEGSTERLFVVMEGRVPIGIGGLIRSQAFDGKDFEVLCALRSEAQRRGLAKRACELIPISACATPTGERVTACIDDNNEGARTHAHKNRRQDMGAPPPR